MVCQRLVVGSWQFLAPSATLTTHWPDVLAVCSTLMARCFLAPLVGGCSCVLFSRSAKQCLVLDMRRPPNFSLEPTASARSVFLGCGRFGAPRLRQSALSSGCGSVLRSAYDVTNGG